VHSCLGIKEPVKSLSSLTGDVWIHTLVDLCYRIEQAPNCPWQKLRVTGLMPFVDNIRNLGRGNRSSIQGSDDDVMGPLIVNLCLVVAEDPPVKT
jgi:hypothetical protein